MVISFLFMAIILLFVSIVICVSYSCIVVKLLCGAHPPHHGAASRQRKLTITLFIMTIVSDVTTICGCYFSLFSIQFEISFSPGIISFGVFFKDS